MNFGQLRARLRVIIGNPSVTSVTNARLDELNNQAHREIATSYRFHGARQLSTFPTVASTARYTLPTDLSVLMKVWDETNKQWLRKATQRAFARLDSQTIKGKPLKYHRFKNWIEIEPIPDAVYTLVLFYKTHIADMAADIDIPVIPLPWHIGIVYYGRWLYYDEAGDIGKAQYSFNRWNTWVASRPNEVDEEEFADSDHAVEIPTLAEWRGAKQALDFDYEG